ncbi:MAG: Tim44 domain-containing protein [Acidisphaera sp.]|nr:Tim44 domain-containing protein [Acidisphaera sp.]
MGASSGFPVDLVLFGMIAAFLVLRLRSILGRRTGYERPDPRPQADLRRHPDGPVIEGRAEPAAVDAGSPGMAAASRLPDPASPLGQTLVRLRRIDRSFDPARFLEGAQAAFRLIVGAFAEGRRDTLRPLLGEETWRAFDAAITAREAAGETQRSEIKAIREAAIEEAGLRDTVADLTVRFVSDQVGLTLGRDGQPASGSEAVTEIVDLWTFERDLAARDPTWRLVAARSA